MTERELQEPLYKIERHPQITFGPDNLGAFAEDQLNKFEEDLREGRHFNLWLWGTTGSGKTFTLNILKDLFAKRFPRALVGDVTWRKARDRAFQGVDIAELRKSGSLDTFQKTNESLEQLLVESTERDQATLIEVAGNNGWWVRGRFIGNDGGSSIFRKVATGQHPFDRYKYRTAAACLFGGEWTHFLSDNLRFKLNRIEPTLENLSEFNHILDEHGIEPVFSVEEMKWWQGEGATPAMRARVRTQMDELASAIRGSQVFYRDREGEFIPGAALNSEVVIFMWVWRTLRHRFEEDDFGGFLNNPKRQEIKFFSR